MDGVMKAWIADEWQKARRARDLALANQRAHEAKAADCRVCWETQNQLMNALRDLAGIYGVEIDMGRKADQVSQARPDETSDELIDILPDEETGPY